MFSKHRDPNFRDMSYGFSDNQDWSPAALRTLDYYLDISSLAIEPLSGLLAVGTLNGRIHVFGRPGVDSRIELSEHTPIKFLQFACSVFKLLCVDEKDRLYVWDLCKSPPKLQSVSRFGCTITSLTTSPSHTHAFISGSKGDTMTYDLECLRMSPYIIPNLWKKYEERLVASGASFAPDSAVQVLVDVILHPRMLNMVFLAYSGGIILTDLTQLNIVRAYEFVLPPGAPGGMGYHHPGLLTHRRPSITAFAVHPAGHFFAVGYADGCIAFWAVDDDDKPLLVRTIDEIDVQVVDGTKLEKYLPQQDTQSEIHPAPEREPIYKLAWSGFQNSSDPRGGETAITILGGHLYGADVGVLVFWLPSFNPPEPPASLSPQKAFQSFMKAEMRQSLMPLDRRIYHAAGLPQDFLLVPRSSPHFSGTFDPVAILLLSDSQTIGRTVEAFQFPPTSFITSKPSPSLVEGNTGTEQSQDSFPRDLLSALESVQSDSAPQKFQLPGQLEIGSNGVVAAQLVKLERDAYQRLATSPAVEDDRLILNGGTASVDNAKADEIRQLKFQPRRVLLTTHKDLTIRFQDLSPHILVPTPEGLLPHEFPRPFPSLTIDLMLTLGDASVAARFLPNLLHKMNVASVQLGTSCLECTVVLTTGELVTYKLRVDEVQAEKSYREAKDKEITILEHLSGMQRTRFDPYLVLAPSRGPVIACAPSDIGFLAVSYADGSLFIVDMRGPTVLLRFERRQHSASMLGRQTDRVDQIVSLTWTVCSLSSDRNVRVRLIAIRTSGLANIFTLTRPDSNSSWIVSGDRTSVEAPPSPIPGASFVLDGKTGARLAADPPHLSLCLSTNLAPETRGVWVVAGAKGARCYADVNGAKLGKAEWGIQSSTVTCVEIVERNGTDASALVMFTDKNKALVYSVPYLEHLHTLSLPDIKGSILNRSINIDATGDFLMGRTHSSGLLAGVTVATLFSAQHTYPTPIIQFTPVAVPPHPTPVGLGPPGMLSGFLGMVGGALKLGSEAGGTTGEQLDALLAGPDRPVLEPKVLPTKESALGVAKAGAGTEKSAGDLAKAASSTTSDLYARLNSALTERGEDLAALNKKLESLEEGSRTMVTQAKKLALEQSAKSWFRFS